MQVRVEVVHSSGWSTSLTRLMGANQRFITHPYNAKPTCITHKPCVRTCAQPSAQLFTTMVTCALRLNRDKKGRW